MPPNVYYYEPKIFGFKIVGTRGSKYYNPVKGYTKYTDDHTEEKLIADFKKKYNEEKKKGGAGKGAAGKKGAGMKKLNLNILEEKKEAAGGGGGTARINGNGNGNGIEATVHELPSSHRGGATTNRKKKNKQ